MIELSIIRAGLLTGLCCAISGCVSFLPAPGPSTIQVTSEEGPGETLGGYIVIDIDERVTAIASSRLPESFRRVFRDDRPSPDLRIGIGDSVAVTIWEAAAGGLFSAAPTATGMAAGSRTAVIPEQVVSRDGTIRVPYAGRLQVRGLHPAEAEDLIVKGLTGKAIEPQAVVQITKSLSNSASVGGEVTTGSIVQLNPRGDRILDVISAAGGIRIPAHEAFVRLTRGKQTVSIAYNTLLAKPDENIYVLPRDVITVVRDPQTFTAFGSTFRNDKVPFDAGGTTLEEAIAKVGGLEDTRSDPAGIFLLRFEPAAMVAQMAPEKPLPSQGELIPVVYRLNLLKANSFFLARAFPMRDKDILYVANSPSVPVQKFLHLVGSLTSPVVSGITVSRAAEKK